MPILLGSKRFRNRNGRWSLKYFMFFSKRLGSVFYNSALKIDPGRIVLETIE